MHRNLSYLRRATLGLATTSCIILAPHAPARATASLSCSIDNRAAKLELQAVVSRGVGEGIFNVSGELRTTLKGVPRDLAKVAFAQEHLTQSWLLGRELKLRLYRERGEKAPHGYVELILQTRRAGDAEYPYNGSYDLVVHFMPPPDGSEAQTIKSKGAVKCTVG